MRDSESTIDQDILGETAKIPWDELQVFFAAGKAIYVNAELDLIDVATQMSNDNAVTIEKWMQKNQIMHVPDDKAKNWHKDNATVWAVVVKPWVLVQEIKA